LEALIQKRGPDKDSLSDLIEALKVFDSDRDGKITTEEFKYAMSTMGEKMQEHEIEEII
jgi:Ca2+-binding EF-hand superfamily protein